MKLAFLSSILSLVFFSQVLADLDISSQLDQNPDQKGQIYMFEGCPNCKLNFDTIAPRRLLFINTGHVGVSFNTDYTCPGGKFQLRKGAIYGFAPNRDQVLAQMKQASRQGKDGIPSFETVSGVVDDDSLSFHVNGYKGTSKMITIKKSELTPRDGYSMKNVMDNVCEQLYQHTPVYKYNFPPPFGKDMNFYKYEDVFNCATWVHSIGAELKGWMNSGLLSGFLSQNPARTFDAGMGEIIKKDGYKGPNPIPLITVDEKSPEFDWKDYGNISLNF